MEIGEIPVFVVYYQPWCWIASNRSLCDATLSDYSTRLVDWATHYSSIQPRKRRRNKIRKEQESIPYIYTYSIPSLISRAFALNTPCYFIISISLINQLKSICRFLVYRVHVATRAIYCLKKLVLHNMHDRQSTQCSVFGRTNQIGRRNKVFCFQNNRSFWSPRARCWVKTGLNWADAIWPA